MLIVRAFAAAIKPILIGGAVTASAATGFGVWQYTQGDEQTSFERLQSAGVQLVVAEFGEEEDTIVAIDPNDPTSRKEIAVIEHAPEWGILASLAPDGDAIAYTALPSDALEPSPDTPAIAAIVDTDGDVQQLANDVDLLVAPVWSPDGESVVVRKNTPAEAAAEQGAGRFELILLGRDGSRSTITTWNSAAAFPIAFSPDGAQLYFATLSASGSDLYRVGPDGAGETLIAHLSDHIARDWRVSPDGASVAYTVVAPGAPPQTMVLDVATGTATEAIADSPLAEYNPAWRSSGDELTVASIAGAGSIALSVDAAGVAETVTGRRGAIDLPLAWSPDDAQLLVRTIDGTSALDAGEGHLELLDADGGRVQISEGPDATIVGWME